MAQTHPGLGWERVDVAGHGTGRGIARVRGLPARGVLVAVLVSLALLTGAIAARHGRGGKEADRDGVSDVPRVRVPVPGVPSASEPAGRAHGVLITTTVTGTRTGYRYPVDVYLPAVYFAPGQEATRFPVIEVVPGIPAVVVEKTYARLVRSGAASPAILVIPGAVASCGDARDRTYLAEDLPDIVAAAFRTTAAPSGWGVLGYASGGACATALALEEPARFGAAASVSGRLGQVRGATGGDRRPRLYVAATGPDTQGVADAKAFTSRFGAGGAKGTVTLRIAPGAGAGADAWSTVLPDALLWLSGQVRG